MFTILTRNYRIVKSRCAVRHAIAPKPLSKCITRFVCFFRKKKIFKLATAAITISITIKIERFVCLLFFLKKKSGMKFRCASIECPEVFNGPKPECIYQSQFDRCCGKYECSNWKIDSIFLYQMPIMRCDNRTDTLILCDNFRSR